jgi:hypothetical protein
MAAEGNTIERLCAVQEYCHLPQELSKTDGSKDAADLRSGGRNSSGGGAAGHSRSKRGGLLGFGARRASGGVREPLLPVAAADAAAAPGATAAAATGFQATEGRIEFKDVNLRWVGCCDWWQAGTPVSLVLHKCLELSRAAGAQTRAAGS